MEDKIFFCSGFPEIKTNLYIKVAGLFFIFGERGGLLPFCRMAFCLKKQVNVWLDTVCGMSGIGSKCSLYSKSKSNILQ